MKGKSIRPHRGMTRARRVILSLALTLAPASRGGLQLTATGVYGRTYRLLMATNLGSGASWSVTATNQAAANGSLFFTQSQGGSAGQAYYRLRMQ